MKVLIPVLIASFAFASKYYYKPKIPDKYTPNNYRVLAAATCFQCHGSFGISKTKWDSIIGEDVKDFYKNRHPIMKAQRYGFTKKEVIGIFDYLHSLKYKKIKDKYKKYKEYEEYEEHDED